MPKQSLITKDTLLYYHAAIKALLADKVNKVDGESLISDTEIARLSNVVNYDDTAVQATLTAMRTQINALEQGTYDDTQLRNDIASTYATISSLAAKANVADLSLVATTGAYTDLIGAPSSLPASDVSAWAKATTKPTYTAEEVGADAAGTAESKTSSAIASAKEYTDAEISNLYSEIESKISSTMHYKGTVAQFALLPADAEIGDVYNITNPGVDSSGNAFSAGANAAWSGTNWDILPGTVDLTNYYSVSDVATNSDIDTILNS